MFRKTTVELLPLEATKVEAAHGGKGAGADTVVDIKPVLLRVDPFLRRLLETAPLHERWSTRSAHIFYVSAAEACFTFLQSVVCTIVLQVVDETACLGYPIHLFIDGVVFFGYAWTTIFGVILFDMLYLCEVNIPFFRPHVLLPFLSMGFHAGYFILFIVGASYSFSALAHGTTATCNGGSPIVTFALAVVAVFFCSLVILIFVASRSWLRWKQRYEKPIYQPIDEPKQIVVLRGENAHDSIAASPSSPKETLLGQIEEPTEEKDGHVHAGNVVPVRVSVKHLQNPFLSPRPLLPESNAETHAELRSSATGAHADTDVTRHSHSRSHDQDQDHDAEDEDEHPNHWDAHSHQHQHQLPHSMRNDNQDQDDEDGSRRSDGGEQLQDAEALSENQQHSYVGGEGDVARGGGEHEEVRNGADSSRDGETEDNDCNNCDDDDDDDGDYRSRRRRAIPRPLAAARVRGWPPHSGQNASGKECNINAESDADGEEQQTREPSSNADARDVCDLMYEHQRREDDSSSALAAPDLEPELNADHNEEIASAATSRSRLLHRAVGPELGDVEDRHGGKEAFPQAEQSGAEHEDEDNDGPRGMLDCEGCPHFITCRNIYFLCALFPSFIDAGLRLRLVTTVLGRVRTEMRPLPRKCRQRSL